MALLHQVLTLDLTTDDSGTCTESIVLTEGGTGDVLTSLNCSSRGLSNLFRRGGEGGVVHAQSSVVGMDLQLLGNNTGTVLIRVTGEGTSFKTAFLPLFSTSLLCSSLPFPVLHFPSLFSNSLPCSPLHREGKNVWWRTEKIGRNWL